MSKLSGVYKVYKYQNISTTAVLFVELFFVFSPRLIKFSVHGTISSCVVFQNIVTIAVPTVDLFSPSQLMSVHVCKGLEFRVWFEAFYGNDHGKESIYITDGIENGGLSLHYIGI